MCIKIVQLEGRISLNKQNQKQLCNHHLHKLFIYIAYIQFVESFFGKKG